MCVCVSTLNHPHVASGSHCSRALVHKMFERANNANNNYCMIFEIRTVTPIMKKDNRCSNKTKNTPMRYASF